MGRSRFKIHEEHYPYFITMTIVNGILLFDDPRIAGIVLGSLDFIQKEFNVTVYGFVLMPNHLHMIVQSEELADKIRKFKSYTARRILDTLVDENRILLLSKVKKARVTRKVGSAYQLWQEGYHPKQIDSEKKMASYLNYIHYNPVKAGFVCLPEYWRYSSASQYAGKTTEFEVRLFTG